MVESVLVTEQSHRKNAGSVFEHNARDFQPPRAGMTTSTSSVAVIIPFAVVRFSGFLLRILFRSSLVNDSQDVKWNEAPLSTRKRLMFHSDGIGRQCHSPEAFFL